MTTLHAVGKPIYYAVCHADDVAIAGIVRRGQITITGHPLISDTSEAAFLDKAAGLVKALNPLPAEGGQCEAGEIYGYKDDLVICKVSHLRGPETPAASRFTVRKPSAVP